MHEPDTRTSLVQYAGAADPFGVAAIAGTSSQIELTEGTLGIRQFRAEDASSLFEAVAESINELRTWMVWCQGAYTLGDSMSFVSNCKANWEPEEQCSFAIVDDQDGSFLGSIGLSAIQHKHGFANVGYWVRTKRTQRGIGSTALRLIARFAFEHLDLNRLEIVVPAGNKASQRVAEKAGATAEGILRRRVKIAGQVHDAIMYSLVRGDR